MPDDQMTRRPSLEERFWNKAQKGDGCWEWQASVTNRGYGRFTDRSHHTSAAHRIAWELTNGPIPDGLFVCHHCDNPKCVNPAHLFLGTNIDNVRDMESKGRKLQGEQLGQARLTSKEVLSIRARLDGGASSRDVAADFGLGRSTVRHIGARRTWRWL